MKTVPGLHPRLRTIISGEVCLLVGILPRPPTGTESRHDSRFFPLTYSRLETQCWELHIIRVTLAGVAERISTVVIAGSAPHDSPLGLSISFRRWPMGDGLCPITFSGGNHHSNARSISFPDPGREAPSPFALD